MPITDAEFYFILGLQYSLEGNNKQAIDFFITDNALNLEPELENVYFFRALYFYKMKLHEVTIKDFTSAIEIDKHFGEAYLYRVFCKGLMDDLKGATFDMHRPLLS